MPYAVPNPAPWPERYYPAFYDTDKQVPPEALIWIGAYRGGGDPIGAFANLLTAGRQGEPGPNREGHMVTFYVGHLLAKVQLVVGDDLGASRKPQVSGSAFRIWPQPDKPEGLIWPTPALTRDQFDQTARSISIP